MLTNLTQILTNQYHTIVILILLINVVVHVIFAAAVAKDAGLIVQRKQQTILVSPMIWAFAVLVGGVLVAAIYWFMHHFHPNITNKK